ncbi:hypothetical protein BC777_3354 [Yoonia maricola]|uniref:Uncharacterized protein n=1 Tax=Yoonia maricola TaxID=420999 RepID=A0A2M8W356_9RHOB|nr:hypothetical protein [Yoonia maricola]PJI85353.1 hypothetical protein BC777_3354 [Yoonia maricola]
MGPLDAIRNDFSEQERGCFAVMALILALTLFPDSVQAEAADYSMQVDTALKFCQNPEIDNTSEVQGLLETNWQVDSEALITTWFSRRISNYWYGNESEYSERHAEFVFGTTIYATLRVVELSEIDPDQSAFAYRDAYVSDINLKYVDGSMQQYCLLSGPAELEKLITQRLGIEPQPSLSPVRRKIETSIGDQEVQLYVRDDSIQPLVAALTGDLKREIESDWAHRFKPVTLLISTPRQ